MRTAENQMVAALPSVGDKSLGGKPIGGRMVTHFNFVEKRSGDYIEEFYEIKAGQIEGPQRTDRDQNRWFLCGHGVTDEMGKVTLHLSQFIPEPDGWDRMGGNIWFTATADSGAAHIMTYEATATATPIEAHYWSCQPCDVMVTVCSWGIGGNPAPNVGFSWQCTAEYALRD